MIEFDIFFLSPEQVALSNSDIEIPFEECMLKKVAFLHINYFAPRIDHPQYTMIASGYEEFTCNLNYEEVKKKIEQSILLKYN